MNKVVLMGNLGQAPETKQFENGSVTSFTLATNRRYKGKDGWESETEWHNIEAFGKKGSEVIQKYCKAGSKILIEGRIKTTKFKQNDVDKWFTKIIVIDFTLLDKKPE